MKKPEPKDYSYFHQGVVAVPTTSSRLVSSSKYLNNAAIRDWVSTHFLRRNGPDLPVPADTTLGLAQALDEIRDRGRIDELIAHEKTINPKFKAWVDKRFLSPMCREDFAQYPENSFGGIYYQYLVKFDFQLNLGMGLKIPDNDFDFIRARWGQTHDLEHLMTGGGFNSIGELLPYYTRLSNTFQHMSPELAQMMSEMNIFGSTRMEMRSFLHYPTTWLTVLDVMRRGISIGFASDSIIMAPYEDAFHLPIPEAREALGIRNAVDLDTESDDEVFVEKRLPTEAESWRIGRPDLAQVRN